MNGRTIKIAVFSRHPFTKIVPEKSTPPEFRFVLTESVDEADVILMEEGLLTQMEQKIVNAFVKYGSISDVARALHYHPTTVKRCLSRIYQKLKVKSASQAVCVLFRLGILR